MGDDLLHIRLFGAFAVRVGETVVPENAWRLRKAKSLLKLLALSPGRRMHRERVAELLWPERTAGSAANNFHQALYVARRALQAAGAEPAAVLALRDDMLELHPGGRGEVDVEAFEAALAHARETRELRDYRAALELHGGELLPEDRYEAWAAPRREALAEAHLGLLVEYAQRLAETGDADAGVEMLQQAVVVDPLHEGAHRALMRLFALDGRRQHALAQYQRLREVLRSELAAEPDPQTAALYRTLLIGDEFGVLEPAVGEGAARPRAAPRRSGAGNLPVGLTSFIGRERELRTVGQLLDRKRMLTLTGTGGSGKTRLAVEAARASAEAFVGGVWLVELAGLTDPALVPAATAAALGLTLPSQGLALDGLAAQLADRDALVILDNCEHLVEACALLAAKLLSECPGLRILATSRERLRVPGEVTLRVPSLALPSAGAEGTAAELASWAAIRLFCERAADVAPGFVLGDGNARAVAEICLRLDGMPLAVELAAARVGVLSPAQIAERLGDSLAFLTSGSRAALDRQQTLRATLAWSYELLTAGERALFCRLGVFAGTFALEAVEDIAAGGEVTRQEVADLLGRLVDKSLVVAVDGPSGYRYRLLEPIRQYTREHALEAGKLALLEQRHHAHYLKLASNADPGEGMVRPVPCPLPLDGDDDNLRAALRWALAHDPGSALRLAVHLWPMWMTTSRFQEGDKWLLAALAAAPEPSAVRAEALRAASGLAMRLGRMMDASALGAERVAIFRRLGDHAAAAHALDELGVYEYMAGRYDRAELLYAEATALAEELTDPTVAAAVQHSQGMLAHCRGDLDGARNALNESLALVRALPAGAQPFFRVHTVGFFVAAEAPARTPRMFFEETFQFFRRVDARHAIGYLLAALGDVARAQGRTASARDLLRDSLAHFREARDPMGTAFALNRLGVLAGATGEYELGREWLDKALALRRDLGDRRGVGMTLSNLGVLAARGGSIEAGRATLREALALFAESHDAPGQAGMLLNLGHLAFDAGEHQQARELLEENREMAERQHQSRCVGWTTLTLAEIALRDGALEHASALLNSAQERLDGLGDRWGVERALALRETALRAR